MTTLIHNMIELFFKIGIFKLLRESQFSFTDLFYNQIRDNIIDDCVFESFICIISKELSLKKFKNKETLIIVTFFSNLDLPDIFE